MSTTSAGPFRLGIVPGVVPTTWVRKWGERLPGVRIELVHLATSEAAGHVRDGGVDAALLRIPVTDGEPPLHTIPLYAETAVAVMPKDHYLCAADALTVDDLSEEIVLQPRDDIFDWGVNVGVAGRSRPDDVAAAVALVAAGAGLLVVPKSLARLHHRKDLTYRPVSDLPESHVGLTWLARSEDPLIEELIGIIRGRTPNSTRGPGGEPPLRRNAAQKAAARQERLAAQRARRNPRPQRNTAPRKRRGGR